MVLQSVKGPIRILVGDSIWSSVSKKLARVGGLSSKPKRRAPKPRGISSANTDFS